MRHATSVGAVEQIPLFRHSQMTAAREVARPRLWTPNPWCRAIRCLLPLQQRVISYVLRDPIRDDLDSPDEYPTRRWVQEWEKPTKPQPASIFQLAQAFTGHASMTPHADGPAHTERPQVIRDGASVRCVGAAYPSNRWTAEREEAERARRARQKPPKPVKGARTKSTKLRELIGAED